MTSSHLSRALLLLCLFAANLPLYAQGTAADYQRAEQLRGKTRDKVLKSSVSPHWFENNTRFWYRNDLGNSEREFILVDAKAAKREPAFDHQKLADSLAKATGREVFASKLPLDRLAFDDAGKSFEFSAFSKRFRCELSTYELAEIENSAREGAATELSMTPLREPRPTRVTGAESFITFVNRTPSTIKIYWLDTEGQRKEYGAVAAGESKRQHSFAGHVWLVTSADERPLAAFEVAENGGTAIVPVTRQQGQPGQPQRSRDQRPVRATRSASSPDRRWTAIVKDNNLYLRDRESSEEHQLTRDGLPDDSYSSEVFWSPDGKRFVSLKTKKGDERTVNMVESSPRDQLQPKLKAINYLKPGDQVSVSKPHLFDSEMKSEIAVSDELFRNPWSIGEHRWTPDSNRFTFLFNQRGHQVMRIVGIDAVNGMASSIVNEECRTFFDYNSKKFTRYLDDTSEIIWMSERDGWNHLYRYDAKTGDVKNQITKGPWVVRSVDRVDAEKREIWFQASGYYPDQDPYYLHFGRVNFDGTGLVMLTEGDGTHTISYSPDSEFLIDNYSRVDLPPITELRRVSDGKLVSELERADWTALLAAGWKAPERFVAKGRDGETDIYGVIYRPTNFDPEDKYPVLEPIYAGPQGSFVPKTFASYYSPQEMAELGFITVQIDGMGTNNRSKAFHDVCWKNLGDAGLPDRIAWMKAAAEKYPQLDLSRVGIYGGSAGGQNAMSAMLRHPEFYKAAVAGCGCHDNRMDKIWWNELWMSWPVGPHYAESSNVDNAHKLRGKLLLIVGELDDNVDPASTLQVVNALIRAGKNFEMLLVPGARHGMGGAYGHRRLQDFFVKNLLKVEPPDRNVVQ